MSNVTMDMVQAWLDRYVEAWRANERAPIMALFANDATYRYGPFDEPLRGAEAIADGWLRKPDEPDSWQATYRPIATDGDLAVAHGRSRYLQADRSKARTEYDNIFVLRFDGEGRCSDFTEWFVERPRAAAD